MSLHQRSQHRPATVAHTFSIRSAPKHIKTSIMLPQLTRDRMKQYCMLTGQSISSYIATLVERDLDVHAGELERKAQELLNAVKQ